ncbi:LamB/YcsF family protein, partial [Leptospira santarosai]|nr:LamB/YcsF family protein [Leptospira santarosai]
DRTYQGDGTLTSRKETNALITDTDIAISQVVRMVRDGMVTSTDGKK